MATYFGTAGNDTINAVQVAGTSDHIDALAGDDIVSLGPSQTFITGPGNDTVTGRNNTSQYGLWYVEQRPYVDLAQGYALDGFGGRDTLSGIGTVHMTSLGGTVIGSGNDERVFLFGGQNSIDLGEGTDSVIYYEKPSGDYLVDAVGGMIQVRHLSTGTIDTIQGAEVIQFADRTINAGFLTAPLTAEYQYTAHSFRETQMAPGYTYAGVYVPPSLVNWLPQAPFVMDLDGDQHPDLVAPMNKGYASGLNTRTPFLALSGSSGRLTLDGDSNVLMPVTSGARRAETINLAGHGNAVVTVAHDTGDGKAADLIVIQEAAGTFSVDEAIPALPGAMEGRLHAVNAHSLAVGDINGDGLDDVLIGDWNPQGAFSLLQQPDATFVIDRQTIFSTITNGWPMENALAGERHNILIDLALVDVNNDGYDDLIAGWGHGSTSSYLFLNHQGVFSQNTMIALPDAIYGVDNQMHLKTLAGDFDLDGHVDLAVLRSRYEPYYGGNYLQILHNDGAGNFTDITTTAVDTPFEDAEGTRLQWTDYWQLLDVNEDGALEIVGHRVGTDTSPVVYFNDGSGRFSVVEVAQDVSGGQPIAWADFDGDARIEYVTFNSSWEDAAGTASNNRFDVYELSNVLGTGPDSANAAERGAPGFNELYYLNQYADARTAVDAGQFASGLAHYLSIGKGQGRLGFAPNTHIRGTALNDSITLREGAEIAYGLDGDDRIEGGAGNDIIDGGAGIDRAVYSAARADYTVMRTANGFSVAGKTGTDGIDHLSGIEELTFSDGSLSMTYNDVVQQLYVAYFGRAADSGGVANLSLALSTVNAPTDIIGLNGGYNNSATVKSLVDAFGTSAESNTLYAGDTATFVTAVFQNVFDRAPQEAGLIYWRDAIDDGLLSKGNAALAIMAGAFTNTTEQGLLDVDLITKRIQVASNFTLAIDSAVEVSAYRGSSAASTVRSLLSSVTTETDVDAFQTLVSATLENLASVRILSKGEMESDFIQLIGVPSH